MALIRKIGIDLGTANSVVYVETKGIVLQEPTVVAVTVEDNKVVAGGNEAKEMLGRTPGSIMASKPMRDGVIADYVITEAMLRYFIQKVCGKNWLFRPEVMICVPAGCTQVERRAVKEATEAAGATGSDSIDLSTYDPTSTDTAYIDNASLSLPACTVGTQITADVNTSNVVPPSVDIVFVTDYTNTMANAVDGGTPAAGESRIELVAAATLDAVSTIFSTLEDAGSTVRASAVSFYERETDESSSAVVEPQYFVDAAMTSDQSVVETAIGLYTPGGVHYGTPHYKGLEGALAQLAGSVADKKIVVFLSDGVPTVASDGDPCGWGDGTAPSHGSPESSAAYYCIKEAATELVPTNTADTLDDDIKIFTAAITSTTSAKGYMAHLSSDACGTNYSTFTSAECSPADGVEYAYQASTQDEIATMYEDITAAILGVSVGLTTADATVTTGTVTSGHNRELPFPSNFECTGEDMDIPMTVSFNGSGYISMDNISFTYCPVQ